MPFDLAACLLDEHRGPPPIMAEITRLDAPARAALATKVAATLPKGSTVELDVAGMAHEIHLELPGTKSAVDAAPELLAFVRTHACLFGVHDPKVLATRVTGGGKGTWVLFDVKPHSVGVIQADVEGWGNVTRVKIEGHLWPIADQTPPIDRNKLLGRYLGLPATIEVGTIYMVDPKTHKHTGCVPEYAHKITDVDTFRVSPGPILACRAGVLAVLGGAYVSRDTMKPGHAAVLDELPGALDVDGNRISPYIAPPTREPDHEDLAWEAVDCTP